MDCFCLFRTYTFSVFFCIFSGFLNFFWFSSIFEQAVRGPIKWIAFVFLQLTLFHFFCIFSGFFFLGFLPFLNGFSGGPLNALLLSFYNLHFFRFSSIFKGPRGQILNIIGDGRLADHVDQKYQDPAYLHNIDGDDHEQENIFIFILISICIFICSAFLAFVFIFIFVFYTRTMCVSVMGVLRNSFGRKEEEKMVSATSANCPLMMLNDDDDDQRWKNVQILQIYLCYFSLAVLFFFGCIRAN